MSANVGLIDRVLRIVLGLALIVVALRLFGPAYQSVWGWIGLDTPCHRGGQLVPCLRALGHQNLQACDCALIAPGRKPKLP